jgi:hypothetical protein
MVFAAFLLVFLVATFILHYLLGSAGERGAPRRNMASDVMRLLMCPAA